MHDIHNWEQHLQRTMQRLQESNYSDSDKEQLERFKQDMLAEDLSLNRVYSYINRFLILEDRIDFPLDQPSRTELRDLVVSINRNCKAGRISPSTRKARKQAIKKFYQLAPDHDVSELLDFMSINVSRSEENHVDPDTLPDLDVTRKLADAACNPRDKALYMLLFDSGGRIGELLPLTWNQLRLDDEAVTVTGKTGQRTIPLHYSIDHLSCWRELHRNVKEGAPVFCHLKDHSRQLSYRSAYNSLRNAKDRADLDNHIQVNPHSFRKARACDLAKEPHMNADLLCRFFGWTSFDTARYYIKLSTNDMKNAFREIHNQRESPA